MRRIDLTFKNETPLLIASGRGDTIAPLQVTLPHGTPAYLIPSTSWRGAFRAISTSIAPHIFNSPLRDACTILQTLEKTPSNIPIDPSSYQKLAETIKNADEQAYKEAQAAAQAAHGAPLENLDPKLSAKILASLTCPVTRLYGSLYAASKVIFLDTFIPASTPVTTTTHVGIDRKTCIHRKNVLFTEQAIERGATIKLTIIDHTQESTPERKLLDTTIKLIQTTGLQLGSAKTRGLGLLTNRRVMVKSLWD